MRYKMKEGLASRRIAGELFIVDAAGSKLHELNGPAALIWEGLAAGKPEAAVIAAITGEFETDERTARGDYKVFVEELLTSGLLTE